METANFVLGVLCGTVLCGLCYVIVELLKINKRQKAKENEIAEAFRQIQSVEKEFENTHHSITENAKEVHERIDEYTNVFSQFIDRVFQKEMETIHDKINKDIEGIYRCIEEFRQSEQKAKDDLNMSIADLKLRINDKDSAMKSYVDSRIDKTSRGIELVAEGLKNYYDEEELADRVLAKLEVKQREENIRKVVEGLPIAGAPTHYGK